MPSPTSRTLKVCRDRGWITGVVEKWNPHAKVRQDLWGWVDLVALDPEAPALYFIQTTSGSNHSSRVKKCLGWAWMHFLLMLPSVHAQVWSWKRVKGTWVLREEDLGADV